MKYLLDVNLLLAGIWESHPQHARAFIWLEGKDIVLCPLSELGFLRVSSNKKAFNFGMEQARHGLSEFSSERGAERIADDLPALDSKPQISDQVAGSYLADLAALHGLKLATFDTGIKHSAVELVSTEPPTG
jgi:predicted nucleic acid-binding protein